MIRMDPTDKLKLIDELEAEGFPFMQFWGLADIFFTDAIETAAVSFQHDQIQMLFNQTFWDSLGEKGIKFVICHEQKHLILDHFKRLHFEEGDTKLKNIAAE